MKRRLKLVLTPVIVLITIGAFAYYLVQHPNVVDRLKDLPLLTLASLIGLNICSFAWLILVTRASLYLYSKRMGKQENILFNAYSSLINFFGPGQSGPVFRGTYLKKRLNLGVKQYLFATLIYYAFFAVVSVLMMLAGTRPWWQTALAALAVAGVSVIVIRHYQQKTDTSEAQTDPIHIAWIGIATVLQLLTQLAIYGVELHTIGAHATFGQVLSYTGVANIAIFVALTPGAIGIREGFLLFSERLHHISSANIVAANIIDRGVYLVFLGLLLLVVVSLHAKKKLHVNQLKQDISQ